MFTNDELLTALAQHIALLNVAMRTLAQISNTPRNKGAKRNANSTLRFLQTQIDANNRTPNV